MKLLLLAALAAVALSHPSGENQVDDPLNNNQQWPWQVGKLYRYEVFMYTMARQQTAHSGSAFIARFIVRVKSPGQLQMKLENPEHASDHHSHASEENQKLTYQPVRDLDAPFEVSLQGGRVQSIRLPTSISLRYENVLKALLSALQVDLSNHRLVKYPNTYDQQKHQGQFRKMETDITGDCETLYTVSPVNPEWRREIPNFASQVDPMMVHKSKDYGHCHHRVDYHFGIRSDEWSENSKAKVLTHGYTTTVLVGKQGPIYRTSTIEEVQVHPLMYGKQKAEVHSNVTLSLVSFEQDTEPEWQIQEGSRLVKSLLYSLTNNQVPSKDESGSNESVQDEDQPNNRVRRSSRFLKTVSVDKVIVRQSSSESSSSSSESAEAYINDEKPDFNNAVNPAIYMLPEPRGDKKQNPMNVQKLLQDIAQQLQNPNNMPKQDALSKFSIMVRLIAEMSYDQLSQVSRSVEVAKASNNIIKSDMWMIFRDAVVQAGTLPAFRQIKTWIQTKKMEGEEAAEVLATLVNTIRYPTKQAMTEFFNLAVSDEVKQQRYLNSTALIAATRLINMAQVNNDTALSYYPTHMYGRLARKHDQFVLTDIMPILQRELAQAVQENDSEKTQVYIKALGNLGHPACLDVFRPYIEGKIEISNYLRIRIIKDLKVLAQQKDKYVRAALYSILRNIAEPCEVRVAAVDNLLMARPTPAMMQAMGQMSKTDKCIEVRSVLKHSIESAANLKDPRNLDLAESARAVRDTLTEENFGKQYSTKTFMDAYDDENEVSVFSQLSYIRSKDSLLPSFLRASMKSNVGGWNRDRSIESSISNIRDFIQHLMQNQKQQESGSEPNLKYSVEKIAQMLDFKRDPKTPLEGAFYANLFNMERNLEISESTIYYWRSLMSEYLSKLNEGVEYHYTKLLNNDQVSIMFPTATGLALGYNYQEPTVIHMKGTVKGQIQFPDDNKDFSASITYETQMTFATNFDGRLGFVDAFTDEHKCTGIVTKFQVYLPLQATVEIKQKQMKLKIQQIRPEQDTTLIHYSVWPYTANHNKDSLVPISQDPTTKVLERKNRVTSFDYRFGQNCGSQFQLQGYSYSEDYKNWRTMFEGRDMLSGIFTFLQQKDVAATHYNFRYLGKSSPNKALILNAVYDEYHNQKESTPVTKTAFDMQDVSPNSEERRREIVKRVVSGINTAKAKVVDLSATFEGVQKQEYIFTGAIAGSPVDPKMQYAIFAGKNSEKTGNTQVNGVMRINKPLSTALNFMEALKKELKADFEADFKAGTGNIHIQGYAERTKTKTDDLKTEKAAQKCQQQILKNNMYQRACAIMIEKAHTPDRMKVSMTYKDVSPAVKTFTLQMYRIAEHLGFWYTEFNPLKTTADGKLEIELQQANINGKPQMNMTVCSRVGDLRVKNVPIPEEIMPALSLYSPFKPHERVLNYMTDNQYKGFCTVDDNKIRTFSWRQYYYTLSPAWHVVMHDDGKEMDAHESNKDQLLILARRPEDQKQEVYISYKCQSGKYLELELRPGSEPQISVKTNAQKISNTDLTIYWNDVKEEPLLQYYILPDGVLMFNVEEDRLRAMYDGQRLVIIAGENRNNVRGLCGQMSGDMVDDFMTPQGIVDRPDHYAAMFALSDEFADPNTKELQSQARQMAYQPKYECTLILRSDDKWQNEMSASASSSSSSSSSSEENWGSENVYRTKSYMKERAPCQIQSQVQYYENHGEICITTTPLDSCQSHCSGEGYQVQGAQVVCRPKLDQQYLGFRDQIRQGENPQVSGVPKTRQFRVPVSCKAY